MVTEQTKRQRRCIACGKEAHKAELYRMVRSTSGSVAFDSTGRVPGRGAYVCSRACFASACKTKKLERALKTKIDHSELEQIAAEMSSALREA